MRIGNIIIYPWSKKNCLYRIVAILLIALWVVWGIVIFRDIRQINKRVQEAKMKAQRQEEMLRREMAYQQAIMERQAGMSSVQNAVDAFVQ